MNLAAHPSADRVTGKTDLATPHSTLFAPAFSVLFLLLGATLIVAVVLFSLTVSARALTGQDSTVTPTPLPTPTLSPASLDALDRVRSVCLDLTLIGRRTEAGVDLARALLESLEIGVMPAGGDCDATLAAKTELFGMSAHYESASGQNRGYCFTGGGAVTEFSLTMEGSAPVLLSYGERDEPTGSTSGCPTEEMAPTAGPYARTIIDALAYLWGRPILEQEPWTIRLFAGDPHMANLAKWHSLDAYASRPRISSGDLPYLLNFLDTSSDRFVRAAVVKALGTIGPAAEEAIPTIVEWLLADTTSESGCDELDLAGAEALGKLGPRTADWSPRFIEAINTSTSWSRQGCFLRALGSIRPVTSQALTVLTENIEAHCEEAVDALGSIAAPAREAIPALLEVLERRTAPGASSSCVLSTARAVVAIDPTSISRFVSDLLNLAYAQDALAGLDELGASALPYVTAHLLNVNEANARTRGVAVKWISTLASSKVDAVPALVFTLDQELGYLTDLGIAGFSGKCTAIGVLGDIGPDAMAAVPKLIEHIGQCRETNGDTAAVSLQRITGASLGTDVNAWRQWRAEHSAQYGFPPESPDFSAALPVALGIGVPVLLVGAFIIRRRARR